MNTERSSEIVRRYRNQEFAAKRKTQRYERVFRASPAELFRLLCPSREADWIPGWDCDLVYSTTGYVERDCVFTTPSHNLFGEGTWIIHEHVPDERLEFLKITRDIVMEVRIVVTPLSSGGCRGVWNFVLTSLTPDGNELIEAIPERDPSMQVVLDGLEHYLVTGELLEV